MTKTKTSSALWLGLAVAAILVVAVPAGAQAEEGSDACEETESAVVTNTTFLAGGAAFATLEEAVASGGNVTAAFDVEGCGEVELALVSLGEGSQVVDAEAGAFVAGSYEMNVDLSACLAQVVFLTAEAEAAAEAAVEAAENLTAGAEAEGVIDAALGTELGLCADADVGLSLEVCPVELRARAMGDGSIQLDLRGNTSVAGLLLFRAAGDETPQLLAVVEGDSYLDTDTEVGVTYTYYIDTLFGLDGLCEPTEVTSVPFFPGAIGAAIAATVPALAYVVLRRKK